MCYVIVMFVFDKNVFWVQLKKLHTGIHKGQDVSTCFSLNK